MTEPSPEYNALPEEFEAKMKERRQAARQRRAAAEAAPAARTFGDLALLEEIGEGPAGKVWLAQRADGSTCALKVLRGSVVAGVEEPGSRETIARTELAKLIGDDHPNRASVIAVVEAGSKVAIALEHIPAETLDERLRRGQPLPFPLAMQLGAQLCRGLASIHDRGLVHGDIKARNVFLAAEDRAVLSEPTTARDAHAGTNDRALALAGTPTSYAPERFTGSPISVATDIYALGVLLYHAMTRAFPIKGPLVQALRDAHDQRESVPLAERGNRLPSGVVAVVERALAHDSADRFTDAVAMAEALEAAAKISPEQAELESSSGLRRWWLAQPVLVRRSLVVGFVGALLALLLWRSG